MIVKVATARGLAVLIGSVALLGACNAIFGIDEVSKKPASSTSSGGSGGVGGAGGMGAGGDCGGGGCGLPLGDPCHDGVECISGICADETCCDLACDGPCQSCDATGNGGKCTPYEAGTDPEDGCGPTVGCNGNGQCGGAHLWSHGFGDNQTQVSYAVALAPNGDVALTGGMDGTVAFGGAPLTTAGGNDAFVALFDGDGGHRWSEQFGDAADQVGYAIAVDGSGNVVVAGEFDGVLALGSEVHTSTAEADIFLAKLSFNGSVLWSKSFQSAFPKDPWDLVIGAADAITLVGSFEGTLDLGDGPLSSAGSSDMFVARYSASGSPLWSKRFGDGSYQQASSAFPISGDGVVVTGVMEGNVDFDGTVANGFGGKDVFVVKLDSGGGVVWSQHFG
ncbi:MAG: hypothetical protein JRI68_11065, partial [Deltaproteobacteria bacterium]|nr:hypothetical protein [Deltaproteobacteria bacterium]